MALEDIGSQDKAPLVTVSLDSALQLDTSPLILEEASARLLDTVDSRIGVVTNAFFFFRLIFTTELKEQTYRAPTHFHPHGFCRLSL